MASSWLHFGTILAHLSLILGLLASKWPNLGLILVPPWLILAPSWVSWIYLGQRPPRIEVRCAKRPVGKAGFQPLLASSRMASGPPSGLYFGFSSCAAFATRTEVRCAKRPVGKASAWKCSCALVPWLYLGPILAKAGYVTLMTPDSDLALALILASVWHHVASSEPHFGPLALN